MKGKHRVEQAALLLNLLFAAWPEVKRTRLRQSLKYGAVTVNGRCQKRHDHPLQVGDEVELQPLRAIKATQQPVWDNGLRLLYHDEDILVVHKPEGLLSIAADPRSDQPTAYRQINEWCRDEAWRGSARIWIVHRLDRETSGVLLFARSEEIKLKLQENWSAFEKVYVALVEGSPGPAQGRWRDFIDESQIHRVFCHSDDRHGAREAITHYRLLESVADRSLLELRLETGRRHQIRAQAAQAGCPVVGDKRYGAQSDPIGRVALHAASLQLTHPRDGRTLRFESPMPESFQRALSPRARGFRRGPSRQGKNRA